MTGKSKVLLAALGVAAVGGGVWFFATRNTTDDSVILDTVRRGDLVQTVEVTGDVRAASDVVLAFETTGTVGTMAVAVGDTVQAGDVLASLRAGDAAAEVQRAEAALAKLQEGATAEAIAVAQASVGVAQALYDAAVADVALATADADAVAAQAEEAVVAAEDDVSSTATANALAVAQAQRSNVNALASSVIAAREGLSDADQVLGVENTLLNNNFEAELSAADPQLFGQAQRAYRGAMSARDTAEDLVFALSDTSTEDELSTAATAAEEALEAVSSTLLYTSQVLNATFADSGTLSIDDLLAYKATISAARTSVQTATTAVLTATQTYERARDTAQSSATTADNAYDAAVRALASARATQARTIAQANAAVASRAADLVQAQAALAEVAAAPRSADLRVATADLAAAQARYAKAVITAPIDGVITEVAVDAGEQILAGTLAIGVQAVEGQFEITVNIPESDVAAITVGDTAYLTLDAFGDDQRFPAVVGRIDPAETAIEGVTFYEAVLYFADTQTPAGVRPGMSADVTILTDARTNVLSVPQRAVLEDGARRYVRIATDTSGGFTERDVTVGMRADDGVLEILTGVSENERIVVSIRR